MSEGAPDAIQVADRFHLLQNLEETLEKAFKGHSQVFRRVEQAQLAPQDSASAQPSDSVMLAPTQEAESKRAQRLERYEQVHALRQ